LPERASEPHIVVGYDLAGETMTAINVVEVESCSLPGSDDSVGGDEYDGLLQLVEDYEDSVEAAAWGRDMTKSIETWAQGSLETSSA
jgi:hypothetical protein